MFDSSILSALFSAIAAAISALTLWFTRLKGPDIELIDIPHEQVRVLELGKHQFSESIPSSLEIEHIELVFTNSGSRSGIITNVAVDFEPSLQFRPFFREFHPDIKWESESSPAPRYGLPLSIREGDTRVITVDCRIRLIDWRYDWEDPDFEDFKSIRDIQRIVENALRVNYVKLGNFINFLHDGESFGKLKLSITYTGRKRWFWIRLLTKEIAGSMEITNPLQETIRDYEKCLENWNFRRSRIILKVSQLPQAPDFLINLLKNITQVLDKEIHEESIPEIPRLKPQLKELYREKTPQKLIILQEHELVKHLESLAKRIDSYNQQAKLAKDSVNPDRFLKLKNEKSKILRQVRETQKELKYLKEKLAEEVFPMKEVDKT